MRNAAATLATIADQPVIPALEERMTARLATLKENREKFLAEAQRNLAALDAAIAEIAALLDPDSVSQNGRVEEPGEQAN